MRGLCDHSSTSNPLVSRRARRVAVVSALLHLRLRIAAEQGFDGFGGGQAAVQDGIDRCGDRHLDSQLGGQPATFMGLAGMGDLILTCTGDLSRNRRVGIGLAAGKTLPQILDELGHVAEGVSTAREVARLAAQLGIEMPITEAVDGVLYRQLAAAEAVATLLSRDPKPEMQ